MMCACTGSGILAAAAGHVWAGMAVELEFHVQPPHMVRSLRNQVIPCAGRTSIPACLQALAVVICVPGGAAATARFRPLSVMRHLPEGWSMPAACTSLVDCLDMQSCADDMSNAVHGAACTVLPGCWCAPSRAPGSRARCASTEAQHHAQSCQSHDAARMQHYSALAKGQVR